MSKAEDRSSRTNTVHLPESADIRMSLDTFSSDSRNDVSCLEKFLSSDWSRFGFLSFGSTMACLKVLGNTPEESDKLNILVTHGPILSKIFTKSLNGSTSTEPEEGFILATSAEMSSRHTGLKEDQTCKGGSAWPGLHKEGGGILSFVSLILSTRKVKKVL